MYKSYIRGWSLLGVSGIFVKMKGLIIMPLLTRHFGTLDYGVWSQLLAIVLTFSPLIALGTDQALQRIFTGKSREQQNRALSALLIFLGISSIVVSFFVFVMEEIVASLFFGDLGFNFLGIFPFAILFMVIGIFANVMTGWMRMQGEVGAFSITTVFQALLGILAVIILLLIDGDVLKLITFTILAEGILLFGLIVRHTVRYGWSTPEIAVIPKLLRYGIPLLPAAYAMWGINWVDRLFLVAYRDLEEVGIYSLVYGIGLVFIPLLARPFWAMFPTKAAELFNNGKKKELQNLFNFSAGGIIVLLIPTIAGLSLVNENLILTLATPDFLKGASIVSVITAAYAINSISSFYEVSLGLAYRQIWSSVSIVLAIITNIILNTLWVPEYGMYGAAWATLVAFTFKLSISFSISLKTKAFETKLGFLWEIVGASLIMIISVLAFQKWLEQVSLFEWQELILSTLVGVVVYSIAIITLCHTARAELKNLILLRLRTFVK